MPTVEEYLRLIPPPNSIQPKFLAWLQAVAQIMVDIQDTLNWVVTAFDVNSAVGQQLDILGQVLQVSRTVNFQPSGGVSPVLTDENYRLVLKAKIILNQWKGTLGELYSFWNQYFPDNPILVQDNQDMTMNVLVVGMAPGIQQELVENGYIVPKPAGVLVNYTFASDPVFAYDYDNTYLSGYDVGYWSSF